MRVVSSLPSRYETGTVPLQYDIDYIYIYHPLKSCVMPHSGMISILSLCYLLLDKHGLMFEELEDTISFLRWESPF